MQGYIYTTQCMLKASDTYILLHLWDLELDKLIGLLFSFALPGRVAEQVYRIPMAVCGKGIPQG